MRHRLLFGLAWLMFGLAGAGLLLSPRCVLAGPGELSGAFSSTQWSTIGDAGNRRPTDQEAQRLGLPNSPPNPGRVDYAYRMATTEVTVGQHLEFLQAYSPFMPVGTVNAFSPTTGQWISLANFGVDEAPLFTSPSARHNWATTMSMRLAARMVNWLHNGQVNEAWAFESGVYDTSTFGIAADGVNVTDDYSRALGARYWIPSIDEYYKAAFYDPSKSNDDGSRGGYWQYPNGSDSPSSAGLPGEGGETNRGTGVPVDVGSYPSVITPWGLLDVSGGEAEYTDTPASDIFRSVFTFRSGRNGSMASSDLFFTWQYSFENVGTGGAGLRLATAVPSPGISCAVVAFIVIFNGRKR